MVYSFEVVNYLLFLIRGNPAGYTGGIFFAKMSCQYDKFIYICRGVNLETGLDMEININGKVHKIVTEVHAEQCDAYHEALARGDGYAAHLLHLPVWYKPIEMIQSEIRMLELGAQLEYELERVKDMPNELLELEIRNKFKK